MFGFIFPFDTSCSGFFLFAVLMIGWITWSVGSAAKAALKNDTVREAGKLGFLMWLDNFFRR